MLNLDEWQQHLLVLNAADVRPRPSKVFGDEERQKGSRRKKQKLDAEALAREAERKAEEKRPMSWIWISQVASGEATDAVHNECKWLNCLASYKAS
jgi:hypothetical protein